MRGGQRFGEQVVAGAVLIMVALGVATETLGDPLPDEQPPVATGQKLFVERALFCHTVVEGMEGTAHLTTGPAGDDPLLLDVIPGGPGPRELQDRVVTREFRQPSTAEVISYGGFAVANTVTNFKRPVPGLGAASCVNSAARRWYFAQGSSAPGFREFLILYNPFPDEAVARVDLVTPDGIRSKANLADVAVPSGGTTAIRVNDFILQEKVLGAQIEAVRGRIVAWKTVFARPENRPEGVGSTVGARKASPQWFFPAGAVGPDVDERISVLNPTDREAIVTISLVADEKMLQPEDLVEVSIPGHRVKELSITDAVGRDVGAVSAMLRSENGVEVIAERAVWYRSSEFKGFSLSLGAPKASASWWLGPAAAAPRRDAVVVLNVGQEEASITIELLIPEGKGANRVKIDDVTVPAGGRAHIPLEELADGLTVAILRSSAPVIAERVAYSAFSNDVAATSGIPID